MSRQKLVIEGVVDPHVHLRGMAWAHKGDFYTETCAAVAGGYWLVCDMPNTTPATLSPDALQVKLDAISAQAVCDWGVYYGASADDNTETFGAVYGDVCGIKMFCNDTTGHLLIEDQAVRGRHYAAWQSDKPIAVHAEGETVAEVLALVREYGRRTHFCHISTAYEMRLLTAAKAEGLPVTVGVCPHHLWLTEDDLSRLGTYGWMKPMLKTYADRDALWEGLLNGVVDCVESDHAPHTREEKESDTPPYGVPGLETTLPLLFTAALDGRLTLERATALVSTGPRGIWGLVPPAGTYTVLELDTEYILTNSRMLTKPKWSPFEGMRAAARVSETWIRGVKVYDGQKVTVLPGFGVNAYA
jgi:carbamoyl-phosphate synthase/aspartate carbamoyltransferase/dihydroorotase